MSLINCTACGEMHNEFRTCARPPWFQNRIHVIPIGDVEVHAAQVTCWCRPVEAKTRVWAHNAKDCREARERITGKGCSEGWINIAEFIPPKGKN